MKPLDTELKIKYNLSNETDLCQIEYNTEDDWLEKRKTTLGGSDIGVVLGLNDYTSKLQLYKTKKGLNTRPTDSVYIRKGKELENLIFTNYVKPYFEELDYQVYKPNIILSKASTPWLSANLDGLAIPNGEGFNAKYNIVVEIKWVSEWGAQKWDTSEEYGNIPASYYAQVQDYMYHTGAGMAVVFAMFDNTWTCERYEIKRNEGFIRNMVTESEKFYNHHLVMDIPPKPDIKFDSKEWAEKVSTTEILTPKYSEEYDLMLSKYKALKESSKEIENESKELLNKILEKYVEGYLPKDVPIKFSCTKRTMTTIDSKKLKELYPDIAAQCSKVTEYPFTSIK